MAEQTNGQGYYATDCYISVPSVLTGGLKRVESIDKQLKNPCCYQSNERYAQPFAISWKTSANQWGYVPNDKIKSKINFFPLNVEYWIATRNWTTNTDPTQGTVQEVRTGIETMCFSKR